MEEDHQQIITGIQDGHQFFIEDHDQAIALLNDDRQEQDNRIQAIQYENVTLEAQRDVYKT